MRANRLKHMKLRIWVALVIIYIVWGSTYLAIRFAVADLPPFFIAAVRFLTAGSLLFGWMRLSGQPAPSLRQWRATGVVGVFLLLGGNGLVSWAEQRIVSGVAALLIGSTPLWMALIDTVRAAGGRAAGVRMSGVTWLGVLLGFGGVVLLISPGDFAGAGEAVDPIGAGALVLAALLWASGSIYGREHHHEMPKSPLLATGMEMLVGGAALLMVSLATGEWGRLNLAGVESTALWSLGYLIVFGSLIGYSAYSWLIGVAPMPLVATYAYVNPLVAVFMGWLLASEPLSLRVVLAAVVIVSAVVVINLAQFKRAAVGVR